jgi:hypothetical protein
LQEDYDVYLAEQQPLQEGEEKHIISVFVADESGLINRVAGVFARQGASKFVGQKGQRGSSREGAAMGGGGSKGGRVGALINCMAGVFARRGE